MVQAKVLAEPSERERVKHLTKQQNLVRENKALGSSLQKQIKDDIENMCFICGIDRNTFDRKHAKGFMYHIEHEHNIWQYLAFILHLQHKKTTELTGPESYVKDMLVKKDLSFFPILKTSSIIVEDVSNERLLERVELLEQRLMQQVRAFI